MGASVKVIDDTYRHIVHGSLDRVRTALEERGASRNRGDRRTSTTDFLAAPPRMEKAACAAASKPGATGLEPATSGVTGLFHRSDDWRRLMRNRSIDAALRALAADLWMIP
jgi:hypothetical protein